MLFSFFVFIIPFLFGLSAFAFSSFFHMFSFSFSPSHANHFTFILNLTTQSRLTTSPSFPLSSVISLQQPTIRTFSPSINFSILSISQFVLSLSQFLDVSVSITQFSLSLSLSCNLITFSLDLNFGPDWQCERHYFQLS